MLDIIPLVYKQNNNIIQNIFLKNSIKGMGKADSGERENLNKMINNFGLQKKIKFMDYVGESDLPFVYNAADLFVFPSLYEGFGFSHWSLWLVELL